MSRVEQAIEWVKNLDENQAEALLEWIEDLACLVDVYRKFSTAFSIPLRKAPFTLPGP